MPKTFEEMIVDLRIDLDATVSAILESADDDDAEISIIDVANGVIQMIERHYIKPYRGLLKAIPTKTP